jgi:hypothetical protein
MRSYAGPSEKDSSGDVESASCSKADGHTTLTFTRNIAAAGEMQRALTPGTSQPVVVAWGDGTDEMKYHNGKQGQSVVDFAGTSVPLVSGARTKGVTYALALGVTCITLGLRA